MLRDVFKTFVRATTSLEPLTHHFHLTDGLRKEEKHTGHKERPSRVETID